MPTVCAKFTGHLEMPKQVQFFLNVRGSNEVATLKTIQFTYTYIPFNITVKTVTNNQTSPKHTQQKVRCSWDYLSLSCRDPNVLLQNVLFSLLFALQPNCGESRWNASQIRTSQITGCGRKSQIITSW